MKPSIDYAVENHGTIFLFRPLTDAAAQNLREHVSPEARWFGGALVVEHRYAFDLAQQLQEEGWVVK